MCGMLALKHGHLSLCLLVVVNRRLRATANIRAIGSTAGGILAAYRAFDVLLMALGVHCPKPMAALAGAAASSKTLEGGENENGRPPCGRAASMPRM